MNKFCIILLSFIFLTEHAIAAVDIPEFSETENVIENIKENTIKQSDEIVKKVKSSNTVHKIKKFNAKMSTEYNGELKMKTRKSFSEYKKEIHKKAKDLKYKTSAKVKQIKERNKEQKIPTLEEKHKSYSDIESQLNLSLMQKAKFYKLRQEEKAALKPLALNLASKQARLDELNAINCKWYDRNCKVAKQKNILNIESEIRESKRQIRIKKEYYMILYKNVLTREQGLIMDEIIHDSAVNQIETKYNK